MNPAQIILKQLGGNKFLAMTGAKNLLDLGKGLSFKIGAKAKDKITHVQIKLNGKDLYDVKFMAIRGMNINDVAEVKDVHVEDLQRTFTEYTGVYTSL